MLYNNPPAYGTDFTPPFVAELAAANDNLVAVKESSGDARRVTAIKALVGDRLDVLVGMDDMVVEGVAAGAVGWVAGLVNAFPRESVALFDLARAGKRAEANALYRWFLPLLRLDTVPEFVQLIKLVQQQVGQGDERVRLPRLPVHGALRAHALAVISNALATRPELGS
jgi:4-hydroxy-tetrahydrodipicolinate synthase